MKYFIDKFNKQYLEMSKTIILMIYKINNQVEIFLLDFNLKIILIARSNPDNTSFIYNFNCLDVR